jgi:hypothetical protein
VLHPTSRTFPGMTTAVRRLWALVLGLFAVLGLAGPAAAAAGSGTPAQPTSIQAFHRDGQTFVTWVRSADSAVVRYRIYRHDAPIDAGNIGSLAVLFEQYRGSANFYSDRYFKQSGMVWEPRYLERFVIQPLGSQLAADQELLVWTLDEVDFGGGSAGTGYYAVTAVDDLGNENLVDFGAGNSTGAIAEQIDMPMPVHVLTIVGGQARVYTQFMDLRNFNPTLSAPNSTISYYGLDQGDPEIQNAIQYAFNYVVFPPDQNGCGQFAPTFPVIMVLHAHGGERLRPLFTDPDNSWCPAFRIYPIDPNNTWWFGFAKNHDYRTGPIVPPTDTIVNYTEQRVFLMINGILNDPVYSAVADPQRIYTHGHSMGASGALAMALRYPNYFAAVHASQPMTNYLTSGDGGGIDWLPDVSIKWGSVADALPIELGSPLGEADHLQEHNGQSIWAWQNHQQNVVDRRGDDFVPLGIDHGLLDETIEWSTQGQPFYGLLDAAATCWAGEIINIGHFPSDQSTLPAPLAHGLAGQPYADFQVVKNETVPGLSNATAGQPLPPSLAGQFNHVFDWSTSWDPWDGAPLDQADRWRVAIRSTDLGQHFVDVTPRRKQAFTIETGVDYAWTNEQVVGGTILASGLVQADADGLLTVPQAEVTAGGSRIELRRPLRADVAQLSLSAGGSQQLSLWTADDFGGMFYVVLGSLSGTSPGLVTGPYINSVVIPLNPDAYFDLTLANPFSPLLPGALGQLDAAGRTNLAFVLPAGAPAVLAGVTVHHAAVVIDPQQPALVYASNPAALTFVP